MEWFIDLEGQRARDRNSFDFSEKLEFSSFPTWLEKFSKSYFEARKTLLFKKR